jgi:glycine/D-amino acid oxidase-like deaminating enzyme
MLHTVIVGGGIAGLSLAWQLASDRRVTLLEQESFVGTHSSARNAQIWLPIDDDETTGPLGRRSAELLTGLLGLESAWLRRGTAIVISRTRPGLPRWTRREREDLRVRSLDARSCASTARDLARGRAGAARSARGASSIRTR